MSSSSTPACNQSRKLEPSSRKAVNGRLAEPNPQGSRPLARAGTSLELLFSASTCLVRATLPTLSLQPKLWLTGASDVPHAESVGQVELSRRAATCRQQRCTASAAVARVQAQTRPIALPRTSRPWPHYALCV